jgi:hypothetical protein
MLVIILIFSIVMTIINLTFFNQRKRLDKTQADQFSDTPEIEFHTWKMLKEKEIYYRTWLGVKLFLITILFVATSVVVPETAIILMAGICIAFIFLFINGLLSAIKARKLEKEHHYKIM